MQLPEPPETGNPPRYADRESGQSRQSKLDPAQAPQVLLVGASIRSAAQSAKKAGFQVTGVDLFGDIDTRQACERYATFGDLSSLSPRDFDEWVNPCEGCQCVQVGGVSAINATILDRISASSRCRMRTASKTCELLSPEFLRDVAQACGISFPPSHFHHELVGRGYASLDQTGWIRKAAVSSGGLGVRWADAANRGNSHADLWQRWIAGRNFGVSFFSDGLNACLLGICRSSIHRLGDRPFIYAGSFGPIFLASSITAQLALVGETIARRSHLKGLFGLDVIIDRSETIALLEVNPRWTASSELIERAVSQRHCSIPGKTLMGAMLRAVAAEDMRSSIETIASRTNQVGYKRIVYARRSGRFDHAKLPIDPTQILEPFDEGAWRVQFCDVPCDGHLIAKNEPILSLILTNTNSRPGSSNEGAAVDWWQVRHLVRAVQQSIEA